MRTEDEAWSSLSAKLPSERARAAQWLTDRANPQHLPLLVDALEQETVPTIRRLLQNAIKAANDEQAYDAEAASATHDSVNESYALLDSLAGIIRHETEPAIGWLRRSAAQEIGAGYQTSETFRNIDLLRQRLTGLETLAAAHRMPSWRRDSLTALITSCMPAEMTFELANPSLRCEADQIDTDPGLMSIIVGNALSNAAEASSAGPDLTPVLIDRGVTDHSFWVSVTNRFSGHSFDFEHVAHTGTSTKERHKGLGLTAMRLAAQRLNYEVQLKAQGGIVFFSVRGDRYRE